MGLFDKLFSSAENQKAKKDLNILDYLPIAEINNDLMIIKDGRVCVGYRLDLPNSEAFDYTAYASFARVLESNLKSVAIGSIIQKIDLYYNEDFKNDDLEKQGLFFEKKHFETYNQQPVLNHSSYLFFISPPENTKLKKSPIMNIGSQGRFSDKNAFANLENRIPTTQREANSFIEGLKSIPNLTYTQLKSNELQSLVFQFLNCEFGKEQTVQNRVINNLDNCLGVGEKKLNIISLMGQAEELDYFSHDAIGIATSFTAPLGVYLQIPHVNITSIRIEDTEKELSRLDIDKRVNTSFGKEDNQTKENGINELTVDIRANQKKFFSLTKKIIVYAYGESLRGKNVDLALSEIRAMYGAEGMVESYDTYRLFMSCLPGCIGETDRWLLMPSDVATAYVDFTTKYRGPKGGIYLSDRFRNPVFVNLFNRELNNQNSLIIGPSGSGKSMTVGFFMIQRKERKDTQIIIDVGGTYKRMIKALKGEYLEYDPMNPIEFNPFGCENIDDVYKPTEEKVSFLVDLLGLIWKGDLGFNNAESSFMITMINLYYISEKSTPSLNNFVSWFVDYDDANETNKKFQREREVLGLTSFFLAITPFTGTNQYGKLLNSSKDTDLSDFNLICFDMAKVKDNAKLYPLITMLLTEMSLDIVRKQKDKIKYFYMDEAWSMIEGMGDFVEYMYRTLRKNNGGMTTITQGVDEIVKSKIGPAIIANSETKIILNHTDANMVDNLGKHLGFTSHELAKIKSIRVTKECREVFIKQGTESNVFTIEINKHAYAVLTSNPIERNHLDKLIEQKGGNIEFATEQWIEDKANGLI